MPYRVNRQQAIALFWFRKQFDKPVNVNVHHLPYITYSFFIIDKPSKLVIHIDSIMEFYNAEK